MTPCTVACQAPLSMGFPKQEYWSGLPFPSPGDLPNPGIKPMSPVAPALAGRFFTTEPPRSPNDFIGCSQVVYFDMTPLLVGWQFTTLL